MTSKIGFIGTGIMGRPMAGHLAKAGHSVLTFSRSNTAVEGCTAATSVAELTADAQVRFQPPDEQWRALVPSITDAAGNPANSLNVYAELLHLWCGQVPQQIAQLHSRHRRIQASATLVRDGGKRRGLHLQAG